MTECANQTLAFEPRLIDDHCYLDVILMNEHGLHARPSAVFFEKILKPYSHRLKLAFKIHNRNAKDFLPISSLLDLLGLGLEYGTNLTVRISYQDESVGEEGRRDNALRIAKEVHHLFHTKFSST